MTGDKFWKFQDIVRKKTSEKCTTKMNESCKQLLVQHFPMKNLLRSDLRKVVILKMFWANGVIAEDCIGNI